MSVLRSETRPIDYCLNRHRFRKIVGGVISPLLLNVALHGMEAALGVQYKRVGPGNIALAHTSVALVGYADDLVVLCHSQEEAREAAARLDAWLAERGLTLSTEKTRIVHIDEGFDFLGFTVRRYPDLTRPPRHKFLIRPSRDSQAALRRKLKDLFRAFRGSDLEDLISTVNPVIRGWANYFRRVTSSSVFHALDGYLYILQVQWVMWRHRQKSRAWQRQRYWGSFHGGGTWIFGAGRTCRMEMFSWTTIRRHTMVRRFACWDDPTQEEYWKQRSRESVMLVLTAFQTKVARRQNGLCPWCRDTLINGEPLQELSRPQGNGRLIRYFHRVCYRAAKAHQKKTGRDPLAEPDHPHLSTTIA